MHLYRIPLVVTSSLKIFIAAQPVYLGDNFTAASSSYVTSATGSGQVDLANKPSFRYFKLRGDSNVTIVRQIRTIDVTNIAWHDRSPITPSMTSPLPIALPLEVFPLRANYGSLFPYRYSTLDRSRSQHKWPTRGPGSIPVWNQDSRRSECEWDIRVGPVCVRS